MRPSLTRRLLIFHVATVLVVVGIAGFFVWAMMRRALRTALDETLQAEAHALAGRLEFDHGRLEFEAGADRFDALGAEAGEPLVHIIDEQGATAFVSAGWKDERTWHARLTPTAPGESILWFTEPLPPHGGLSRILAFHVAVRTEDTETPAEATSQRENEAAAQPSLKGPSVAGAWIILARPLAPIDRTLNQLASVLAAAAGAAALGALATGYVAARRGARPVRALAESVGRVNPEAPELCVDPARVPMELAPIVATTERLLERVRGALARQRQLTADVAHDLRTPLAGVRTLLDVCAQRERTAPEYAAAIDKARAALRQLSQLLDDVLTLSRLDAGVDQPVWTEVALTDVLSAAVATVQPLAAAHDVTVEIAVQPTAGQTVALRTDRGKLVKVLANLLNNAVEHSPPGEAVRLAARIEDQTLELAVADHGPGIPPDLRNRIFERFVRGDAARASGDGHHGLGLPIVAGLAQILGGMATLDEHYESGSRFIVRLPLK